MKKKKYKYDSGEKKTESNDHWMEALRSNPSMHEKENV